MSCDRAIRPGHRWFVSAQSWPSRSGKRLSGSCDPGEWHWWELLLVKCRKCVVDYQQKLRWFSNLLSVLVARLHGWVLLLTLCSDREATNTSKGSPVLICPPDRLLYNVHVIWCGDWECESEDKVFGSKLPLLSAAGQQQYEAKIAENWGITIRIGFYIAFIIHIRKSLYIYIQNITMVTK